MVAVLLDYFRERKEMAQEIADSKLIDTWSSSGLIVKPDISKIIEGWQLGEQPPHEYMNWLQNTFGSKLNHILKNGVTKWNDETPYLAGSSVQHSGNVWLCKTTNTNSAPTDANANWKRIITVEALTTVLSGYVATTGNQTIDDIKTFTSSPIVPTPTTGGQAVNKDYADLKVALSDFTGTNQSISNNGYQKIPGGFIIQWGLAPSTVQGGSGTNIFPVAFPNSCLSVVLTDFALVENLSVIWGVSLLKENYFNYYWSIGASGIGSSPTRTPFYIAIGY